MKIGSLQLTCAAKIRTYLLSITCTLSNLIFCKLYCTRTLIVTLFADGGLKAHARTARLASRDGVYEPVPNEGAHSAHECPGVQHAGRLRASRAGGARVFAPARAVESRVATLRWKVGARPPGGSRENEDQWCDGVQAYDSCEWRRDKSFRIELWI